MRRELLLALNVAATVLTVLTGLRDNAVLSLLLGRFGLIRARLAQGRISYDVARVRHLPSGALPSLADVAADYKFYSAPARSPHNVGEDRSTCLRVNSMNASALAVYFDDAFGTGARREQFFVFSISAPRCQVINFKPQWVESQCRDSFKGNASACAEFILADFETLARDRDSQVGVPVDFGVVGAPFLRCEDRSQVAFTFMTDLMVLQSFWAGGSFQIEFQSSVCSASPVAEIGEFGLFRVEPVDQHATVAVAIPSAHWLARVISTTHAVVALLFVVVGLSRVVLPTLNLVPYICSTAKRERLGLLRYIPLLSLIDPLTSVDSQVFVHRLRGKPRVASNLWMNHWLYILFSILDAVVNMRSVYMQLTMGTWMLSQRVTFDNFVFMCTPLRKMAWLSCLAHTVFSRACLLCITIAESMGNGPKTRRATAFARWYMSSVGMLTSYKIYVLTLALQLWCLLKIRGTTTYATRASTPKRPVLGATPQLASVWQCEIAVDLIVICAVQVALAHLLVSVLLLTRIRHVTKNRVLLILQERYIFVGWDAYVVMDALSIDPFNEKEGPRKEATATKCTIGELLSQFYASGPSAYVELAGDVVLPNSRLAMLTDEADGNATPTDKPRIPALFYPLFMARRMGLIHASLSNSRRSDTQKQPCEDHPQLQQKASEEQRFKTRSITRLGAIVRRSLRSVHPLEQKDQSTYSDDDGAHVSASILTAHAESRWGRLVLVDRQHPPLVHTAGQDDFEKVVLVQDALALLGEDAWRDVMAGRLMLCVS